MTCERAVNDSPADTSRLDVDDDLTLARGRHRLVNHVHLVGRVVGAGNVRLLVSQGGVVGIEDAELLALEDAGGVVRRLEVGRRGSGSVDRHDAGERGELAGEWAVSDMTGEEGEETMQREDGGRYTGAAALVARWATG